MSDTPEVPKTPEEVARRRQDGYRDLMAHYLRWLYTGWEETLAKIADGRISDEDMTPARVRAWMSELHRELKEGYEAAMAVWFVPDEHLDHFIMFKTHPEWRKMMEEAGYEWAGSYWRDTK